ncbi:MAG: hypothetical protein ACYCQK_01765 [Acidiferrobacteraceae bacterium]
MSLTFPTGRTRRGGREPVAPGTPTRASHCTCAEGPWPDSDGSCLRCGRYLKGVIAQTWEQRARQLGERRQAK